MIRRTLHLAPTHAAAIIAAARVSFPRECCGLLEGVVRDDGWHVTSVHGSPNLADHPEQNFVINPQLQFDLLRRLRGTERTVIGCFHSHPHSRPEPSNTDLVSAVEQDFLWLIAAGNGETFDLRAYIFTADQFKPVAVVESDLRAE